MSYTNELIKIARAPKGLIDAVGHIPNRLPKVKMERQAGKVFKNKKGLSKAKKEMYVNEAFTRASNHGEGKFNSAVTSIQGGRKYNLFGPKPTTKATRAEAKLKEFNRIPGKEKKLVSDTGDTLGKVPISERLAKFKAAKKKAADKAKKKSSTVTKIVTKKTNNPTKTTSKSYASTKAISKPKTTSKAKEKTKSFLRDNAGAIGGGGLLLGGGALVAANNKNR